MQVLRITNVGIVNCLFLLFLIFAGTNSGLANASVYEKNNDLQAIKTEAYHYFHTGMHSGDKKLKEAYLSQALAKYMLLLNINPKDADIHTQLGIIHSKLNHYSLAKEYFIKALNMKPLSIFSNYYYAEYLYERRDFENALNYYKVAYDNGYNSGYEINSKLGTVYEKLGDIEKARHHYSIAANIKSDSTNLNDRIKELEKVDYNKSAYIRL